MEKLTKKIYENHNEIIRYYEEPSYTLINNEYHKEETSSFLEYITEKPMGKGNNLNLILKCNFRLLGLVNAYDLDKRYKKTKKSCVRALYKLIKEKTKRKKTQERLEKDYYSFMKCQPS